MGNDSIDPGKYRESELYRMLQELNDSLQKQLRAEWNRDLPFADAVFDRWERAKRLGFGDGASIYQSSHVFGNVTVGVKTWVGPFTILDGTGGLEIGSFCSISAGVQVYTHDSVQWALSGGTAEYDYAPVKIGDRCYIGPNTIIAKGVTIGEGCVIGANSLVLKHVPAGSRVFGNPARQQGETEI